MKRWGAILILILLFAATGYGEAFESTGLITMPTADLLTESYLNLSYQHIFTEDSSDLINFSYGVKPGVQIGGQAHWTQQGEEFNFYPGLKVNLTKEKGTYQPLLSLGIKGWENNLYLAASKMIPGYGVRVHLGVGDKNIFDNYYGVGVSKILNPVVISTDKTSWQMPRITVQAEYNENLNLGTKFKFGSGIRTSVDIIDFEHVKAGIAFENEF